MGLRIRPSVSLYKLIRCCFVAALLFAPQTQRRLEGDRFYTQDFAEEFYTREGLDWVENTTMSVILR